MSSRAVAFVTEEWEFDGEERWLPGLFSAHVEIERDGGADLGEELPRPLPIAEAIAWALERADGVLIRDGDERCFGIGAALDPPDPDLADDEDEDEDDEPIEPWRDELAATFVRRRPAGERWRDRDPSDPPIAWSVEALLGEVERIGAHSRTLEEPEATDAEARATIARWAPERWSDAGVVACRAQEVWARERAERAGMSRYFSSGDPRWSLIWTVSAPIAELAIAPLRARLTPPEGWAVEWAAIPAV